ncbi:MAG: hypothetical protein KAW12_23850 [Candidatus Aminicenantes bacterium]|nr:hypothetical protein [Candidatus Aminicenantes bacterium]
MKKISILAILFLVTISLIYPAPKGQWEVGFHYSYWSVNIIADPLEEAMEDSIEGFDPAKGSLDFESNGNNYGFEVRFFPGGKQGSFSLGLSYERNNFKGELSGSYQEQGGEVRAEGFFDLRPHSFNLSLRWDLWPSARVHPYLGLGFGIGPLDGLLSSRIITTFPDGTVIAEDVEEKTLEEVLNEAEDGGFSLSFFPIIHLHFGLRGEIVDNLFLLAEFALYDGLILRGGVSYRF